MTPEQLCGPTNGPKAGAYFTKKDKSQLWILLSADFDFNQVAIGAYGVGRGLWKLQWYGDLVPVSLPINPLNFEQTTRKVQASADFWLRPHSTNAEQQLWQIIFIVIYFISHLSDSSVLDQS